MKKQNNNGLIPVVIDNTNKENENQILISTILRNATDFNSYMVARIPIFLLNMAPYQRKLQQNRVEKIASEWDPFCAKDILVSYRDGTFWIVDGQHTVAAAKKIGLQDIQCKIRLGLTYEQEARLFAEQGDNVKKLTVRERHAGYVEAGETNAVSIKKICEKYGVTTQTITTGNPYLKSVSDANRIVKQQGVGAFEWIVDTVVKCGWRHDRHAFSAYVLRAFQSLYSAHGGNDKMQGYLVSVLRNDTPVSFMTRAAAWYPMKTKEAAFKEYLADAIVREIESR